MLIKYNLTHMISHNKKMLLSTPYAIVTCGHQAVLSVLKHAHLITEALGLDKISPQDHTFKYLVPRAKFGDIESSLGDEAWLEEVRCWTIGLLRWTRIYQGGKVPRIHKALNVIHIIITPKINK